MAPSGLPGRLATGTNGRRHQRRAARSRHSDSSACPVVPTVALWTLRPPERATRNGSVQQTFLGCLPSNTDSLLEVGARDGYLSGMFAKHVPRVVSLDILPPASAGVTTSWIQGDASKLPFSTASFDVVLCAEVLEHLNSATLSSACAELKRVTRRTVIIGVPFEQDLRIGRTTCRSCGRHNPPYGHVNRFTLRTTVHSVSASPSDQCELCRCDARGDELVGYTLDGSSWKPVGHVRPSGTLYPLPVTVDSAPAAEPPRAPSVEGRRYAESHPDSLPCLCSFVDACVLRTAYRPAERAPVIRMRDGSHTVSSAMDVLEPRPTEHPAQTHRDRSALGHVVGGLARTTRLMPSRSAR